MAFSLDQLRQAYQKLRTYIYFDSTDLLLRKKLVEFETNRTNRNDLFSALRRFEPRYGNKSDGRRIKTNTIVDLKLATIAAQLNNHATDPSFFDGLIENIGVDFYPKKFREDDRDSNFVTNQRVQEVYEVERVNAFIDAPIELHLISVLWILLVGKYDDAGFGDRCLGNRLLLNQAKDNIVQGSGLFKPYFKQYQKWRDNAMYTAKALMKQDKNVLFLSMDIRDYFHSVRIPTAQLFDEKSDVDNDLVTLKKIFLQIHICYTKLVAERYQVPSGFYNELDKKRTILKEVILPIGLLSSYVLANKYLQDFDRRIDKFVKPAYYGRYVDDLLLVIADPKPDYESEEEDPHFKFDFKEYKTRINTQKKSKGAHNVSFDEADLTKLERFVLYNFYPVLELVDTPDKYVMGGGAQPERCFKIAGYPALYCQRAKSSVFYFDATESSLVVDKLKKELDEKTSEFRDFPEDGDNDDSFEDSAYFLQYDGSDGKIRTLKDYKENRFGLTVYLANKIFAALRHEKDISHDEANMVLTFFRGSTCLNFYRLWERIFTFFLVNRLPQQYVNFYLHCVLEIEKIEISQPHTKVSAEHLRQTMIQYLDVAHEMALALNPGFIQSTRVAEKHFEFQMSKVRSHLPLFFSLSFEPTTPDSFWVRRFRETNMMRHHYVVHPLLNYTIKSKTTGLDLTSLRMSFDEYVLDSELLTNSPRRVKYWECCLSVAFSQLAAFTSKTGEKGGKQQTTILGLPPVAGKRNRRQTDTSDIFQLDHAFELYKQINASHFSAHQINDDELKQAFFSLETFTATLDQTESVVIQEITIPSKEEKLQRPTISFANTEVRYDNILQSIRGTPNLDKNRYAQLSEILRSARKVHSDLLLFPESFIPINLLSSLVRSAEKNQILTITGLEHILKDATAFNFIVTIAPVNVLGISDAVVLFRLKNHYAPNEEETINGNFASVPVPAQYRYDIVNWRNMYLSPYYCFELTNVFHRSLVKSKIDLLVCIEFNKDTPYFSNIVEASARDLHVFVAQVNTSQYGDSRLTQPVETARKDILRLKGGSNDAILVGNIDMDALREFQRQKYAVTSIAGRFKPLPPDFHVEDVISRINNHRVLVKRGRPKRI